MRTNVTDRRATPDSGFTMIEIMVVVVILVVLVAVFVPMFRGVNQAADTLAAKQMMATIQMGLNAYNNDFNDYPPSRINASNSNRTFGIPNDRMTADQSDRDYQGAEILAMALMGPAPARVTPGPAPEDGKDGYGWKGSARKRDKIYGPYLQLKNENLIVPRWDANGDRLTIGEYKSDHRDHADERDSDEAQWNSNDPPELRPKVGVFVLTTPGSTDNRPILYYHPNDRKNTNSQTIHTGALNSSESIWANSLTSANGVPRFDVDHNSTGILKKLDHDNADGLNLEWEDPVEFWADLPDDAPSDDRYVMHPVWTERRQQLERSLRSADFLLVSAGSDDIFGVVDEHKKGSDNINVLKESDDVIITGP